MNRITADQARGYPKLAMDHIYAKIHDQVKKQKQGDVDSSVFFDHLNLDQINELKKDGYDVVEYDNTDYTKSGNCSVRWK